MCYIKISGYKPFRLKEKVLRMGKKAAVQDNKTKDRKATIVRAGMVGLFTNILLAVFKASAGLATHSIAIILDGVNSMSDALSSIITITGAKLSAKAPDKKHPLGYGRVEYISSMIVTVIVLLAGLTSAAESIESIIKPEKTKYDMLSLFILVVAILAKVFLAFYMTKTGKETSSSALIAAASDSKFDAVLSLSVLFSAIVNVIWGLSIESYVGLIISGFIIKAGLELFAGTMDDILGKRIDREFLKDIKKTICRDPEVLGAYDLILHNYGTGHYTGSVHVEVADSLNAVDIDLMQRRIFKAVYEKHNVTLEGIGIYALSSEFDPYRDTINDIVRKHKEILQSHGFFFDPEAHEMHFDIIINYDAGDRKAVCDAVYAEVQAAFPDWKIFINPDIDF